MLGNHTGPAPASGHLRCSVEALFAVARVYMPTSVALPFSEDDLRAVAKALQNAATHAELPSLFRDCDLSESEPAEGMPKWSRIFNTLAQAQNRTGMRFDNR